MSTRYARAFAKRQQRCDNDIMTIDAWLQSAIARLKDAGILSARLDAELLLAHTLRKGRTWLHAHNDTSIDSRALEVADARLDLRCDRVPVAYIIGHKEFYGRRFTVTTATLIPRPESETMIELLQRIPITPAMHLVDIGTGTGCLGITAKLEWPAITVDLVDIDSHALAIAQKNANRLGASVTCLKSDLLSGYPYGADIILANLPYVDPEWEASPETYHEPSLALFADDNGLQLIKKLIVQCKDKLRPNGYILLEADLRQHHAITHFAQKHHLRHITTKGLIAMYQSS